MPLSLLQLLPQEPLGIQNGNEKPLEAEKRLFSRVVFDQNRSDLDRFG